MTPMTPIEFPCPECNAKLRIKPENAGKKLRCPKCKAVVQAPAAPADAGFDPPALAAPPPAAAAASWPRPDPDEGMDFEPAPRKPAAKPVADSDEDDAFEAPAPKPPAKAARPAAKAMPRPDDDDEDEERSRPIARAAAPPAKKPAARPGPMVAIMVSLIALLYIGALVAVFLGLADSFLLGDVSPRPPQKSGFDKGPDKFKGQFPFKDPIKNPNAGTDKKDKPGKGGMTPQEARARLQSIKNLKGLAIAMLQYDDAKRRGYPPAAGEAKPDPNLAGLSWRAHLLPFLGKNDILQRLLKGEFPVTPGADDAVWNRPGLKNLKIEPFLSPLAAKNDDPWLTRYRVFLGKGAYFESGAVTSLARIRDGSSNTLMLVEAGDPVPWTKPDEIHFDPSQPPPKLKGPYADGVYAVFGDATVCFIPKDIDPKTLHGLITCAGGEKVNLESTVLTKEDMDRLEAIAESDQPKAKMPPEEARQRLQAPENPHAMVEQTIRAMISRNGGDTIDNLPPPVDTKKLGRLAGAKDL